VIEWACTGKKNLSGASNYWQMVISLRPYLFQVSAFTAIISLSADIPEQCAAAIFQVRPKSAIFRLPALAQLDVREWMKRVFPSELAVLKANEGSPVDLARIQNHTLRMSLEEVRVQLYTQNQLLAAQGKRLEEMMAIINRRTSALSPAKAYSNAAYSQSCETFSFYYHALLLTVLQSQREQPQGVSSPKHQTCPCHTTMRSQLHLAFATL
jgi:hypothetical protein